MAAMRADKASGRPAAGLDSLSIEGDRISALLRLGTTEHELAFRAPGVPLEPRYEPFLVAALPIAMSAGSSLSVPEPVSPRLLDRLGTVQEIFTAWVEGMQPIEVEAEAGVHDAAGGRGTASFFSRGVDSFYTVLRNLDEIDSLVYTFGFDVSPDNRRARAPMSRAIGEIAAELQRPVVEVETNLREVSDLYCRWGMYHGAFLASVGLVLAPTFRRMLVPATYSYASLISRGSHALLDPMWSTEAVEFVHEGAATRTAKVEELSRSELAMRTLRVCWNEEAEQNCGQCEKCLRTMAALRIAGTLERCATMPDELPLRALSRVRMRNEVVQTTLKELLMEADARRTDRALAWVLRYMVTRGVLYQALWRSGSPSVTRLRGAIGAADRRLRR